MGASEERGREVGSPPPPPIAIGRRPSAPTELAMGLAGGLAMAGLETRWMAGLVVAAAACLTPRGRRERGAAASAGGMELTLACWAGCKR